MTWNHTISRNRMISFADSEREREFKEFISKSELQQKYPNWLNNKL